MVISGGSNGLEWTGAHETIETLEIMIKILRKKGGNVFVMNIPVRRRKERGLFGKIRRTVNRMCLEKLTERKCDGLHLNERIDWEEVWARDGVHQQWQGKKWVAWSITKWVANKRETRTEEEGRTTGKEKDLENDHIKSAFVNTRGKNEGKWR